jgi:hypothetical protein
MKRLVLVSLLAACSSSGGSGPGPDGGGGPHAPVFLTFGTNVSSLTENETVVFSAVLTDPDGIADLIGGALKSPDGTISYGAFATSDQEGAYSLSLTWDAIEESQDITFQQGQTRMFMAEFFDAAGHKTQKTISLQLTCNGMYACGGKCLAECGAMSTNREACSGVCAANHGMTCDPSDPLHARYAAYGVDGHEQTPLDSCSSVPAATYIGEQFFAVSCGCTPGT